jgi:hypothetical protein
VQRSGYVHRPVDVLRRVVVLLCMQRVVQTIRARVASYGYWRRRSGGGFASGTRGAVTGGVVDNKGFGGWCFGMLAQQTCGMVVWAVGVLREVAGWRRRCVDLTRRSVGVL